MINLVERFRLVIYPDGYESQLYAASNLGYLINLQSERIMVGAKPSGQVKLAEPRKPEASYQLKQLIVNTFELADEDYPYVVNVDGNKHNCCTSNLFPSHYAKISPKAVEDIRDLVYVWLERCEAEQAAGTQFQYDIKFELLDPIVKLYNLQWEHAYAIWSDELGDRPLYFKQKFTDRWVHERIVTLRNELGHLYPEVEFYLLPDFMQIDDVAKAKAGYRTRSTIETRPLLVSSEYL